MRPLRKLSLNLTKINSSNGEVDLSGINAQTLLLNGIK